MPQSYDLYESVDGATNEFDLTFGYIDTTHVSVTVDGVSVDFEFMTATRVALDVTPAENTDVRVLRNTPLVPLTDFSNGSVYGADDLDRVILQAMYVAQESADNLDSAISLDATGRWDALNARLINLGAATAATDAVSKAYVDALVIDSGNVPTPLDPADDNKILIAAAGVFAWQALTAARVSDSTAIGRSVLTAADAAAVRTALGLGAVALLASVGTSALADDSVTLAKMEHGTAGDLLVYGASGVPTRLAKGDDGKALGLVSGAPAWVEGAALTLVEERAVTAVTAIAFTDLEAGYDHIFCLRNIRQGATNNSLFLRTSPDTGGTPAWDAAASDYWHAGTSMLAGSSVSSRGSTGLSYVPITWSPGAVSFATMTAEVVIPKPSDTNYTSMFIRAVETYSSPNNIHSTSHVGERKSEAVVNAVGFFLLNATTFDAQGTISHYKRKAT